MSSVLPPLCRHVAETVDRHRHLRGRAARNGSAPAGHGPALLQGADVIVAGGEGRDVGQPGNRRRDLRRRHSGTTERSQPQAAHGAIGEREAGERAPERHGVDTGQSRDSVRAPCCSRRGWGRDRDCSGPSKRPCRRRGGCTRRRSQSSRRPWRAPRCPSVGPSPRSA